MTVPIDITRLPQAQPFQPAGHHGVGPVHLFGGKDYDGAVTATLSHYLPGGRADMSPVPMETLYVVLTGTLTIDAEGDTHDLHPLDAVRLTTGTLRSVENRTNLPASMMVIRPNPAAAQANESSEAR
ncbi:cupin domain-containing protein [Streptomyces sp. NPDC102360]|uniref:cupin domain-containing protein n=1 Tax=Streptomyces sp. NPDC102360 TaxID=3366160 RepID=UPI00380DBF69